MNSERISGFGDAESLEFPIRHSDHFRISHLTGLAVSQFEGAARARLYDDQRNQRDYGRRWAESLPE